MTHEDTAFSQESTAPEDPFFRNALSEAAYREVKRQIITAKLPPGSRLNLDRLSATFNVSVTPIREALHRLTAEGLVKQEHGRGFSVEHLLDLRELDDLSAVRCLLEKYALEVAVPKITDDEVQKLTSIVGEMEHSTSSSELFDAVGFNEADRIFHMTIVSLAKNQSLSVAYAALNVHFQIARLFQKRGREHARSANEEHATMLQWIKEGNVKASQDALQMHVDNGVERLHQLLRNDSEAVSADETKN